VTLPDETLVRKSEAGGLRIEIGGDVAYYRPVFSEESNAGAFV